MEILERLETIINLNDSNVLFEFGCCDGYHTNIMLGMLSKTRKKFIYNGFEPVKDLFDGIKLNYDNSIGTASIFNKAIGAKDGVVDFYKSDGFETVDGVIKQHYYGSSSIRKPKLVVNEWPDMTFEKITTELTTFDTHLKNNSLENIKIDFVWADIQGAEIDLINGGQKAFQNVKYFFTEYCGGGLYDGEIGLEGIMNLLPNFSIVEDYGGDVLLVNNTI